ncbi:hypothetical protein EW145_g1849 [Phellinidium pouzarii]|uniref:DUF6699 domain-containing protein n=1 Tax=Phellinidium pouzarii TaxID=167371 RepID=A0A4S4LEV6_9AGAM|nr:hypothetical protein EW145_g1849 [Phellinidium pouzarii]
MPYEWDRAGFPIHNTDDTYLAEDTYLRPVVPPMHSSPYPSPHGSPNCAPMYLDENFNYYQPGTTYVGVPMLPASFMPLPPSPSMLNATFVPLPPSPRVSPRRGPIPLGPHSPSPNGYGAYPPYYPPQYAHPFDPYYFPQGMPYHYNAFASCAEIDRKAGPMYMNPAQKPLTNVNPLIKDSNYVYLDLSSHFYAPLTPSSKSHWHSNSNGLVPINEKYLAGIASHPPVTKVVIRCSAFGSFKDAWKIIVEPGRTVTIRDVLHAVHRSLQTALTHVEWAKLSERETYEASRAYTRRCRKADFERMQGVRRVDLLNEKCWFGGISKVKDDDPHNFELSVRSK